MPASLCVAVPVRNEGNGLRCVYHGLKFDVEPVASTCRACRCSRNFKGQGAPSRVPGDRARRRRLGLTMGAAPRRRRSPSSRRWSCRTRRSASRSSMRLVQFHAALEGDIDPSHSASCAPALSIPTTCPEDSSDPPYVPSVARRPCSGDIPRVTTYAAFSMRGRPTYWRFAISSCLFCTQQPHGEFGEHVHRSQPGAGATTPHHVHLSLVSQGFRLRLRGRVHR